MAPHNLKIIKHNVLQWLNRRISLSNTYRIIDPDIILINSHGVNEDTSIRIPGYNTHTKNSLNNQADGTAIAIKKNIRYKLLDNFLSDLLAVEITTTTGQCYNLNPIPTTIQELHTNPGLHKTVQT